MDGPGRPRTDLGPAWAALVERLKARSRIGMVLGMERLSPVLAALGHPERAFPAIHVAGSNGKGSTSAFIATILGQRQRRVGLYTSPHLVSLTERVQVIEHGIAREIDAERLLNAFEVVERTASDLTFFEVITAAGLVALDELGVDVAVIEAGIGARNDATRAVDASVSVLAELSLEHTRILGGSLAAIADDKSAVIRPGRPLVMADAPREAMDVVERAAAKAGAPVQCIGRELFVVRDGREVSLVIGDRRIDDVRPSLLGPHQARNALLATAAALLFEPTLTDDEIRRALAATRWPGRMEVITRPGEPPLLLDGAHNPQGVDALVTALVADPERFGGPLHVVFAVLDDKDAAPMVGALARVASTLTLTRPGDTPRARSPQEVAALLPAGHPPIDVVATVAEALDRARASATRDGGWVVVAGSLYLVGEVRAALA